MWKNDTNTSKDAIIADKDLQQEESSVEHCDENPERGNWSNKAESLLSMIGFAIGLGNIWRFPYLAYRNGGGAFLIPYFVMMFVCGIPLVFLESAVGQFSSQGANNVWKAVPLFQGVGLSEIVTNTMLAIYYNVIIAYSLFYLFASFQSSLPWSSCLSWADSSCSKTPLVYCNVSGVLVANWTEESNSSCPSSDMVSVPVQSPSEQYWEKVVLQTSSGLEETGQVVWHLALCLLLSSMIVAAALVKGIKSSGKIVYFTATFPFLVILILVIRGVTLEGAKEGIEFYIGSQSNLTKLTEAQIWTDAASQTFFSLSIGWGGVVTLASYNNFHNNIFLDSLIVVLVNNGTSVFAGFAIFSILGHMAHVYGKPVGEVVTEGFGLAFVAYPEALATLPFSPLWSILFFFMLFILGLDTQFALVEVITTCLADSFPTFFKTKRAITAIVTCCFIFLLGLPCVTRAGIYWVTLIDQFAATWVVLILALMEIIGFCYIYGANRLIRDIEMMIGKKSFYFWMFWRACWYFVSPCVIVVIVVWSLLMFVPPTYDDVPYPSWGIALGWCMTAFILLWIPVVAVWKLMGAEGNPWERLKSLCRPSKDWHPYLSIHRGERYTEERCHQRSSNKKT